MSTDAWTTESTSRTKPSKNLMKRARKRLDDVSYVGKTTFRVEGNAKLGDAYSEYIVTEEDDNTHVCSCQGHHGGQYRKQCSHILAVVVWKRQTKFTYPDPDAKALQGAPKRLEDEEAIEPLGLIPEARDASWGSPPLPSWVESFRPHQERAIADIVDAFERGAKYVFLDAPTGAGKTLIAEAVRRRLGLKALYACTTKTLQDQFATDFDYSKVVKGRKNYPTVLSPVHTAADCNGKRGSDCTFCPLKRECPYIVAKVAAINSPIAVVNTAYALGEWSMGEASSFAGRGLAIIDEADTLEGALMRFSEIRISERQQKKYGIEPPEKKTVEDAWLDWTNHAFPRVRRALRQIPAETEDPKLRTERRYLESLALKIERLRKGLEGGETDYVYTGYEKGGGDIIFKPVKVDTVANDVMWSKADRFLLMSASIISPDEMVDSLGIPDDEWDVVYVPCTFPAENRPVYRAPVANVTSKHYDTDLPKLVDAIAKIMDEHLHDNILVHTVSYHLARDLTYHLGRRGYGHRLMSYDNGAEREEALSRFKARRGAVMLAPSLDRGVDLPGDLCRVQVIAKIPYPYMGDKQVKARMHSKGGQTWYRVQTIRTMVQMTGRAVRSKDDHAVTYILDKQFNRMWKSSKRLFPRWWRDGVDSSGYALRMLKDAA